MEIIRMGSKLIVGLLLGATALKVGKTVKDVVHPAEENKGEKS